MTRVLPCFIVTAMILLDRDRQIVLSIGRFGQLAAGHVRALHFDGLTERPVYRALNRLVERKVLSRIERRMIGGTGAGSGQYVYQLGPVGWRFLGREGRYNPSRAVNHHTMALVDAYMALREYENRGRIRIDGIEVDQEGWRQVGRYKVTPDLFVEIADLGKQRNLSFWIEIDMGNQTRPTITDKLARYVGALNTAESFVPYVLFIAQDGRRAAELRWMIEKFPDNVPELFMVSTASEFAGLIFG